MPKKLPAKRVLAALSSFLILSSHVARSQLLSGAVKSPLWFY
jgi:hypothetical protein